jgi:hypothetical protein
MMERIIILFAAVSFAVMISGGAWAQEPMDCFCCDDDAMAGLDIGFIVAAVAVTAANIALVTYNSSQLDAGTPSGGGGMGGILVGALGTIYGTAIIFSDEPTVTFAGAGCAVVGALSFFYGFSSTRAVNRQHEEDQGRRILVDPILVGDGSGNLGPGLQVSWKF